MKHPVDIHVGQRVRQRRWMLGMSMRQLADKIGITARQVRKLETSIDQFSARGIRDIAAALEVPVAYFFEGLDAQAPDPGETGGEVLTDKEALELVRAYYAIPENQRRQLLDLACVLSKAA
ncbi:MAG: helix-turn-helix domain-containing protein [Paracoccaceae bacterium]